MLLQARYENGEPISDDAHRRRAADHARSQGHETTSTQLSWTIERIRRHPNC